MEWLYIGCFILVHTVCTSLAYHMYILHFRCIEARFSDIMHEDCQWSRSGWGGSRELFRLSLYGGSPAVWIQTEYPLNGLFKLDTTCLSY